MKVTIIILSLSIIFSQKIYNASDIIEELRRLNPANKTILLGVIENAKEFLKHYIYYKIASDPPQPEFNGSYFPKINIDNLFDNITTTNANYFDFKNEFYSAVYKLNDFHTVPFFQRVNFKKYIYVCPIELTARYDNQANTVNMYGTLSGKKELYYHFKNYEQVVKVIEENLNTPIKSINQKDPFTFIQEFSGINLRSQHSTYDVKQFIYTKNSLDWPIILNELTNFTVVYESEATFTSEYLVTDISNSSDDFMFYENEDDNKKFIKYLNDYINNKNPLLSKETQDLFFSYNPFENLDDLILEFERKNNVHNGNIFLTPNKSNLKYTAIDWKYTYRNKDTNSTVFQCRVDEDNKVNVMVIYNFGGTSDSEPSLDVAEKCAYLFDENDYRIVVILPRNGGGNPIVGYNIIELLNPYILVRNSLRIKNDTGYDKFIELYNTYNLFDEFNSTKKIDRNYFRDGFINETYGDYGDIIEEFSKPFAWRINQKKIEEIKKKLKHKRTSTEILVLTDGYAFSAASIFMKYVYKSGAGIVIGFNGNPKLPDNIFDISQSPSAVSGVENYVNIYPEIYKKSVEYLIGIGSITCIASYHDFQESHTPQEYDVQIADKRIKIFYPYNDIYYQEFITEAVKVLDSYKNNCNPSNKMLVFFSEKCEFGNHLHGGFGCGSDSKWNESNCVPVYCDSGFYYNKISNSCIEYPMENDVDDKDDKDWVLIVIIVSIVVLVIISVAIALIVCYKKKLPLFKNVEKTEEPMLI